MKEKFRGYYRPTKTEFSQLWENCLFVFDTNVILNIYRYSPNTRNNLIQIFNKISDRLWIPYQAALEYQKRRLDVIVEQESAYEKIKNSLNDTRNKLKSLLNSYKIHPVINSDNIFNKLDSVFKEIEKELNVLEQEHPNLIESDNLRDEITELFEGKVGSPCSPEILEQIYKKGKVRYDRLIPPGFKDNKKEINEYGDLVLWFQIIEHAKYTKKPIIFITEDKKEDWWLKYNGEIIGPKPELINEIFSKADVNFYMYQTEQFMEYAWKYLHDPVNREAIDEVQRIRKYDENYLTKAKKEIKLHKINLHEIISDFACAHVHARNYKDWFVDIFDLEIEDSNGNEISIDYPDNQFSVDGYEKEIEKVIISYLEKKYGIHTDYVDVLLDDYIPPEE